MRHAIVLSLLALLPLASACAPAECIAPADVDVVAASATPDSAVERVRAAVASFGRWTGGEGVCVEAVYLTDELPTHAADGMVNARGAWVTLSDDPAGPTLEERTVHQLCHAADHALGLSGDVFPTEEAFAEACTEGPKAAEQRAFTVCTDPDPQAERLLDGLFVGDWPQKLYEADVETDATSRPVVLTDVDGEVVPAGAGAAILEWSIAPEGAVPVVHLVEDGVPQAPVSGPAVEPTSAWKLFGGGGESPLLVVRSAHGTHAIRFDILSGAALYTPVPRTLALDEAVVANGFLWGAGTVDGSYGAWRIDLETGEAQPWATPTLVEQPLASHGRIAIPHDQDVLVFDVASESWTAWTLPLELSAVEAMPDAVGSLSVRWTQDDAIGLARLASPMGHVELDVEACGQPIPSGAQGTWVAGDVDSTYQR